MGAIGGLLGLNGGAGGSGFDKPMGTNILQGVDANQALQSYNQSNNGILQQGNLLNALQRIGGLGNQDLARQQQMGLAQDQQKTAGQYQDLANGVGPNPAQAQLAQNTAANVAQTGALMAGQRGGAQNVGLIARQAGQQGAQAQQQAVGQAATLQAQQQIAGLQGLQQQQANIGQTQQNIAGIAGQQAANQIGQTNANLQGAQAQYGNVLNAVGALNNANVSMQGNINSANAGLANAQMQGGQSMIGGLGNAIGSVFGLAEGGEPVKMATGGFGGQSEFGNFLSQVQNSSAPAMTTPSFAAPGQGSKDLREGLSTMFNRPLGSANTTAAATGAGQLGAESVLGAAAPGFGGMQGAAQGAMGALSGLSFARGGDFRGGGKVAAEKPGQKAVSKGDSYSNDKIPAVLSEHEIVLPRSVTLSDDPVGNAARFVQQVIAKRGRK